MSEGLARSALPRNQKIWGVRLVRLNPALLVELPMKDFHQQASRYCSNARGGREGRATDRKLKPAGTRGACWYLFKQNGCARPTAVACRTGRFRRTAAGGGCPPFFPSPPRVTRRAVQGPSAPSSPKISNPKDFRKPVPRSGMRGPGNRGHGPSWRNGNTLRNRK